MKKTEIERIIDAVEMEDLLKKKGQTLIPKYKQKDWEKQVDESVYGEYHSKELELLIKLQYGLKKGLSIKDALYIQNHRYKDVPKDVTSNLLCEYTSFGPAFIEQNRFNDRKKRIILQRK